MNEIGFTPYEHRQMRFLELHERNGFTLKLYSVVFGDSDFDMARFVTGLEIATSEVPTADASNGRPGVGFAILHQGNAMDYVVLGWWDRENELPLRVFVRESEVWRPAGTNESLCVWDLEIVWFERNAYLQSILCDRGASIENYLEAREIS